MLSRLNQVEPVVHICLELLKVSVEGEELRAQLM
jgi:hypothetical protein